MKKIFIVANWKSNFTIAEAGKWFEEEASIEFFITHIMMLRQDNVTLDESDPAIKEIIVCPPFTLLTIVQNYILEKDLPFELGAQNVSPFGAGAYTGEINAKQIKDFGNYVIIGHSERRINLGESDEILEKKVKLALAEDLTPIYCVQDEKTPVPNGVKIVAYEPPTAIGTGNPDTPENAENVAKTIKDTYHDVEFVLYGGSVNSENVQGFVQMENINGVLIGGASLDPVKFAAIIKNSSVQ